MTAQDRRLRRVAEVTRIAQRLKASKHYYGKHEKKFNYLIHAAFVDC